MPHPRLFLTALCVVLLACGAESSNSKPPDALAVFPHLPLPPGARFISQAGSADALQITLFSPTPAEGVTEYYRKVLTKGKWRLIGDSKKPDGTIVLYAEQDGPPMWVRIRPAKDGAGTMVELAGALVPKDSVAAEKGS